MEQELLTLPEHLGFVFLKSLIFCVEFFFSFVDHCFSVSRFLFWPLYCLSLFDLRLLITIFGILTFLTHPQVVLYFTVIPSVKDYTAFMLAVIIMLDKINRLFLLHKNLFLPQLHIIKTKMGGIYQILD